MAQYYVWKNKVITMVKGDNFSFDVTINQTDDALRPENYFLQDKDVLYFVLTQPNHPFSDWVIMKKYTAADVNSDGSITISILPEDTELLMPGKYYYTVKLNKLNKKKKIDYVETVIQKTEFFILN